MNEMIKDASLPSLGCSEILQMRPKQMGAECSEGNGTEPDYSGRFFCELRIDHKLEWPSVDFWAIGKLQSNEWEVLNAKEIRQTSRSAT
jgi:hypothetical protein